MATSTLFPQKIPVAPDSDSDDDSQSGYGSKSEYTTESLTSSIFDYRYEYGRRYHAYKAGQYPLPNDETEQNRLDIVHHTFLVLMDDKLHLAPIDPNPQNILDVGTGTGIWAIDTAERYPSAKVIGTDLSPIQPLWVPPNVHFQVDNAEAEWNFSERFDLIHIRHLGGAIVNWYELFKEAYKSCKPGGWIDVTEYEMDIFSDDGTLPDHLELKEYYRLMHKASEESGRSFDMADKLQPLLEAVGFTNIHHEEAKIPVGPWAADKKQREMGAYAILSVESGAFEAFGIKLFTDVLKMDVDDANNIIQESMKQIKSRKIHSYGMHHFYYGQKPLEEK